MQVKDASHFVRGKSQDGLSSYCRECARSVQDVFRRGRLAPPASAIPAFKRCATCGEVSHHLTSPIYCTMPHVCTVGDAHPPLPETHRHSVGMQDKPPADFFANQLTVDGFQHRCKSCDAKKAKQKYRQSLKLKGAPCKLSPACVPSRSCMVSY